MNEAEKEVIELLREERKTQGLSLLRLAERFGGTASAIHDWEHGHHVPTLTSIRAWAGALGFKIILAKEES